MTKSKSTKKALVVSLFSLLICFAMLVGSTFAWFTDSVGTTVNRIVSGTLNIDIQDEAGNSLDGEMLKWQAADDRAQENILWEPGCTYNLQSFKIVNEGSLALKYKVAITGIAGDAELNEAIEWTMEDADGNVLTLGTDIPLAANAETGMYTISGHMKEAAGNEYQDKVIDGIAITVIAKQDTVEYDSEDNQYDKNAKYPTMDKAAIASSMNNAGSFIVGSDVTYKESDLSNGRITCQKSTTVDLNGKTMTFESISGNTDTNPAAMLVTGGRANVTINGEGTVDATDRGYCFEVKGPSGLGKATLTINGGTYKGSPTAVQASAKSNVYINGGFFQCTPDANGTYDFTLNRLDSAVKTATITVTGGTFVNFDPSNNKADGEGTNYVADGYKVVSETQANGDVWYTVVKA